MASGLLNDKMPKFIAWDEPLPDGRDIIKCCTFDEAINKQKNLADQKGFKYNSDLDALDDFIVVNWAWIVELD